MPPAAPSKIMQTFLGWPLRPCPRWRSNLAFNLMLFEHNLAGVVMFRLVLGLLISAAAIRMHWRGAIRVIPSWLSLPSDASNQLCGRKLRHCFVLVSPWPPLQAGLALFVYFGRKPRAGISSTFRSARPLMSLPNIANQGRGGIA